MWLWGPRSDGPSGHPRRMGTSTVVPASGPTGQPDIGTRRRRNLGGKDRYRVRVRSKTRRSRPKDVHGPVHVSVYDSETVGGPPARGGDRGCGAMKSWTRTRGQGARKRDSKPVDVSTTRRPESVTPHVPGRRSCAFDCVPTYTPVSGPPEPRGVRGSSFTASSEPQTRRTTCSRKDSRTRSSRVPTRNRGVRTTDGTPRRPRREPVRRRAVSVLAPKVSPSATHVSSNALTQDTSRPLPRDDTNTYRRDSEPVTSVPTGEGTRQSETETGL